MVNRCSLTGLTLLLSATALAQTQIREPLDARDARWREATPIADGHHAGAARFDGDRAHVEVGPCPVVSTAPFTLRCAIRTTTATFCTPLMARAGEAVGLSLVLGRTPGTISFEAWSWSTIRLGSTVRVDDGVWHRLEVTYDPTNNVALLFVDDVLQAHGELGPGGSPHAELRLGDNIGAHQPFRGDLDELEVLPTTTHRELFAALAPVLPLAERQAALAGLRQQWLGDAAVHLPTAPGADWATTWPARRAAIRAHTLDALGLTPAPTAVPLDLQIHAERARDGVVVQRVSWVGFPGHRATGWLWRPAAPTPGRHPAVLCPHGHWADGARHPVVAARCAAFARFGWIALAVDSVHVEDIASGVSPLGAMTWHNQRALDVLLARPDVDPTRVACTGASGGGQQTYYLMAVEDRLAAAAPMVMACYFRNILADRSAHCGCNHLPRLAVGIDVPDLCAVFAPRPVLFGSVTGDWTHDFPQLGLPELSAHWRALGGPPPRSRHAVEGHNYDQPMRETVYGFFTDVLEPAGRSLGSPRAEPAGQPWGPADLNPMLATAPNQPLSGPALAVEYLARRPRVASFAALAPRVVTALEPFAWNYRDSADAAWRRASGGPQVPIPVRFRREAAGTAEGPYTVVVDPRGSAALLAAPPAWLLAEPRAVLVDPRPYGEWAPFRAAWQRNGLLLGCGEGYLAAADLAAVCANLPGPAAVQVVGLGEAGVPALLAAHLCRRIARVVTDDLGPTYAAAGNRLPHCPELLRWRDLPEWIDTLPTGCRYTLGGAAGVEVERPSGTLAPPFTAAELAARLRPTKR